MKTIIIRILTGLLAAGLLCGAAAAESVKEEMFIAGSNGDIFGVLQVPETDEIVPLIILSHGFGGNHTFSQDYADHFTAQGFAVFNFDFCGGGYGSKSSGTMMDMSVLTEADDLSAVIDFFSDDSRFSSILLWGSSQGGFVSAYVSACRPDDIRAVVLEFPAIVLQDDSEARRKEDGTFPATVSIMGVKVSGKYDIDATSFDLYDVIGRYTGPVLILHGDKDPIVPLSYSERAAEVYANAELVVMPGQGHGFMGSARAEAMERETAFFTEFGKAE